MNVAQRGTSSTSEGYHTVDRFYVGRGGTDEAPEQAQTDLSSSGHDATVYNLGFRKSLRVQNGNQSGGVGTGDYIVITYSIEARDIANSGWNYTSTSSFITLSFYVLSTVAQNYYGYLQSKDGTSQSYPFETGTLTANTWTKVVLKIPGNSNLQFDNNTNAGLELTLWQFAGTNYTDSGVSLNAWGAYNSSQRMPDNTSTFYTTNNAQFELVGLQLEVGSQATTFEHRSYADELRLCERYFQTSFVEGQVPTHGVSKYIYRMIRPFAGAQVAGMGAVLRTEMRSTPTVTIYTTSNGSNSTTNRVSYYDGSWTSGGISVHDSINTKAFTFDGSLSSNIVLYQFNYKCSAEL